MVLFGRALCKDEDTARSVANELRELSVSPVVIGASVLVEYVSHNDTPASESIGIMDKIITILESVDTHGISLLE